MTGSTTGRIMTTDAPKVRLASITVGSDPLATGDSLCSALIPVIHSAVYHYPDTKSRAVVLSGFLAGFVGGAAAEMGPEAAADLLEMIARDLRANAHQIATIPRRAH